MATDKKARDNSYGADKNVVMKDQANSASDHTAQGWQIWSLNGPDCTKWDKSWKVSSNKKCTENIYLN